MADNIIDNQDQTQQEPAFDAKAELANQMAFALSNGRVALPTNQVQLPDQQQQQTNEQNQSSDTSGQTQVPETPVFTFETLKEKFAYEKPEDVIKEIEDLRAFKANPVTEFEFENDYSKKYFEAIKAGKVNEAVDMEIQQRELNRFATVEVNKDNAADIIKLGMKIKYKELTPSEIDYKYKKQFSIPKEPVKAIDDDDDDFILKHDEWKEKVMDIEMDRILEAKLTKPELDAHKQKLVLPDIQQEVDEEYVNWKNQQGVIKRKSEAIGKAYQMIKDPKAAETKVSFNDEANKISFEVQYQPSVEDLQIAVDVASDFHQFFDFFVKPDGSPDREKFVRAIHFALNPDKVLTSIINQAKNGTIKSRLPNNSGNSGRQLPQGFEMSELDANMHQRGVLGNNHMNGNRR